MQELATIVNKKIELMITDGSIEKIISDRLEKTVTDCVNSSLESYGDFGKSLKKKINDSIQVASRHISFPEYNRFIAQIVDEKFSEVLHENAADHLKKLISKTIEPITKTAKFSDILNLIQEEWQELFDEHGCEYIEIEEERRSESIYVLIKHPEFDSDSIRVAFYNWTNISEGWHIGYISEGKRPISGRFTNKSGNRTSGITEMLFKYYAYNTIFEDDTEFDDICISPY